MKLAVSDQRKRIQRDTLLRAEAGVDVGAGEGETVDVEGKMYFLNMILGGDVPHGGFSYGNPAKRLSRGGGVHNLVLAQRRMEGELLLEFQTLSREVAPSILRK